MTDYTPTVEQARSAYTRAMRNAFIASSGEHDAEFDRMIAVVEAQALEQAARFLRERNWAWNHTDGAMEAARAVELLAIDKSRETP